MVGFFHRWRRSNDDDAAMKSLIEQEARKMSHCPTSIRSMSRYRCMSSMENDDAFLTNEEELVLLAAMKRAPERASCSRSERILNGTLGKEEMSKVRVLGFGSVREEWRNYQSPLNLPSVKKPEEKPNFLWTGFSIGSNQCGNSQQNQMHRIDNTDSSTSAVATDSTSTDCTAVLTDPSVPTEVTISPRSHRSSHKSPLANSQPSPASPPSLKLKPMLFEASGLSETSTRSALNAKVKYQETRPSLLDVNKLSPSRQPLSCAGDSKISAMMREEQQISAIGFLLDEKDEDPTQEQEREKRSLSFSGLRQSFEELSLQIKGAGSIGSEVLTPSLLDALSGLVLFARAENSFELKFSLQRDGASLSRLLDKVGTSRETILAIETTTGHVFGAFCSTNWSVQTFWYGSGDCFLWCLKDSRLQGTGRGRRYDLDNQMAVYPFTGHDKMIQFCVNGAFGVGGGSWGNENFSPYANEPTGIGLMIDGDLLGGETNVCATFANPRLCGRSSEDNEFEICGLEVWSLKDSD